MYLLAIGGMLVTRRVRIISEGWRKTDGELVEPTGGITIIHGIDISTLGLHDLRSRFGIIPQEPILFEGMMRSNIDLIGQHSDEEIWRSLERCQLNDVVAAKLGKLDSAGTSNGHSDFFCKQ
ncbi:AAA+ ATPase domain-containing protein [Artemisia annua]|uniref:AAA+ ATPase domain-containing protein n=1 Tax=Artemisia annua TaxID=35608 RepID=A0A2U1NXR8_ARTAN|nr:AAA+ ATPase domain-containing protein [Artemisia annua]